MRGAWVNSSKENDVTGPDMDIRRVVACARDYVNRKLEDRHRELEERIREEKERLEKWYRESIQPLRHQQGTLLDDPLKAARLRRLEAERHKIESTYEATVKELDSMMKFKGDPVIRVCARLMRG